LSFSIKEQQFFLETKEMDFFFLLEFSLLSQENQCCSPSTQKLPLFFTLADYPKKEKEGDVAIETHQKMK
jgi:hypothetical protein